MKKVLLFAALGAFIFASCSKTTDLYDPTLVEPQTPTEPTTPTEKTITQEDINANVQKVFGVTFDPNHDWSSTEKGEVKITANASVKKVQVIAFIHENEVDGEEITSMKVMNEAELNGQTSITLNYDAPVPNLGIFVAFISDSDYTLKKVENGVANIADATKTRAMPAGLTLPTGDFAIGKAVESWASQRGWIDGEMLYELSDYSAMKMTPVAYSAEFATEFRALVFSYFKNKVNNLQKVKDSQFYNENAYPITTGDDPIIISPAYKCDGSLKQADGYGHEIYNSELYYYYFDDNDPAYQADPVKFLQNLPKYKALQFKDLYIEKEDDILEKRGTYALLYYGEGTPTIGTKGSFKFPAGLKVGFMVRANTPFEEGNPKKARKQGELYGDGRLNNFINNYSECNFKSSKLGTDGPRVAWMTFNGKKLMCWESGTDTDFNDIILDVEGGIELPNIPIEPDYNTYTYCFEDTPVGDYDLNDVVIKAVRTNETTVTYTIVACGAFDAIYIKGIGIDNNEVHSLFGVADTKIFINTEKGGTPYTAYTVKRTVDKGFSLADPNTAPYIVDATTNVEIRLSKKGEDPHGIMIPNDFEYPLEQTCIKDAYSEFNSWGQSAVTSTDWYKKPVEGKVYE